MKLYSVYKIINEVNGKIYIGMSVNPKRRFYQHKQIGPMSKDIRALGTKVFTLEILHKDLIKLDAAKLESSLIKKLIKNHDMYNKQCTDNEKKGLSGVRIYDDDKELLIERFGSLQKAIDCMIKNLKGEA